MVIIEYFLKFDMVVTFVALFTILMLLILGISIPKALLWILGMGLVISIITLLLVRFYESKKE